MLSVSKSVSYELSDVIPPPPQNAEGNDDHDRDDETNNDTDKYDLLFMGTKSEPRLLTHSELNDLIRDLNLTKDKAELLESKLKEKNLLADDNAFYWYRNNEKEFFEFSSGHDYASLPIAYSVHLKETHDNLAILFQCIN